MTTPQNQDSPNPQLTPDDEDTIKLVNTDREDWDAEEDEDEDE